MDIDKQIKVGDMAVVVKWPCCGKYAGCISTVKSIWSPPIGCTIFCTACKTYHTPEDVLIMDSVSALTSWAKKIPPLSDEDKNEFLEDLKNDIHSPVTV